MKKDTLVKDSRPINLNLFTIRFPITAITSILHRISGVFLFLLIPMLLWMLQLSLESPWTYLVVLDYLDHPFFKLIILALLASLIYHFFAGVRHLFMDAHIGDTKEGGRVGAIIVLVASIAVTILAGVWLW
jgi:succinate dehydrogenase / fumarate reductase cytochrome b subunit